MDAQHVTEEPVMVMRPLVSVVDDDESVRESLPDLLNEFGFAVQAFSSAEEFLASEFVGQTRCLILDIAMPGMTGPDLQRELALRRQEIPIIFITAHGDRNRPSTSARAGRRGVPVQAVQRYGAARGARCRASYRLSSGPLLLPPDPRGYTHDFSERS